MRSVKHNLQAVTESKQTILCRRVTTESVAQVIVSHSETISITTLIIVGDAETIISTVSVTETIRIVEETGSDVLAGTFEQPNDQQHQTQQ